MIRELGLLVSKEPSSNLACPSGGERLSDETWRRTPKPPPPPPPPRQGLRAALPLAAAPPSLPHNLRPAADFDDKWISSVDEPEKKQDDDGHEKWRTISPWPYNYTYIFSLYFFSFFTNMKTLKLFVLAPFKDWSSLNIYFFILAKLNKKKLRISKFFSFIEPQEGGRGRMLNFEPRICSSWTSVLVDN